MGRQFYLGLTQAANDGDVGALQKMMTVDCSCRKQIALIASTYRDGGRIVAPNLFAITKMGPTKLLSSTTGFTNVTYRMGRQIFYDKAGAVVHDYPAVTTLQADSIQFTKVKNVWLISETQNNG